MTITPQMHHYHNENVMLIDICGMKFDRKKAADLMQMLSLMETGSPGKGRWYMFICICEKDNRMTWMSKVRP